MIDFSKVKLGKKAALVDSRTIKLVKYLTSILPPAPANVDYTEGITSFGMMLNGPNSYGNGVPTGGLGDCTIAGLGHAQQIWSLNARKTLITPADSIILSAYEAWCGYVLGNASTDQGGVELYVLNYFRKNGLGGFPLNMYADPNPLNLEEVKQTIFLFGGIYIGIQLPISVQNQLVWDVGYGPNGIPGSWGGHAVWVPKYTTDLTTGNVTFTCISWGELIDITQAFWTYSDKKAGPYIDEAHALVSKEFVSLKTGTSPVGLDLSQMEADVAAVAG